MNLIVGLGNPAEKYATNRHNVGFMFVDALVDCLEALEESRIEKRLALCFRAGDLILAKPQTFMNSSGVSVKKLLKIYSLTQSDLYVVHDDLDIRLGEYKIQKDRGPKLHNGIASIEDNIKSHNFYRIRIGVDNRDPSARIPGEKYVLQDFTKEEQDILKICTQKAIVDFLRSLRDGK